MIDESWGFDPSSAPYEIRFHRANYVLFGRYSDNVNSAPFPTSNMNFRWQE